MKNTFESLRESVSEECFNEILSLIEEEISRREKQQYLAARKVLPDRQRRVNKACDNATKAQILYGDGQAEGVPYKVFDKNMKEHILPAFKERETAISRKNHAKKVIANFQKKTGRTKVKDTQKEPKV